MKTAIISLFSIFLATTMPGYVYAEVEPTPKNLIVFFKQGQSPDDLLNKVEKRKEENHFWQDITLRFAKKDTPEQQLSRLLQIDSQTGMVIREPLQLKEKEPLNAYLLHHDSTYSIEQLKTIYESLPEVSVAEVSWIDIGLE